MTTILVAEDNPVNCELLRELLEARGYSVIEAPDGQEALRMIEQSQPDIVLLDIGMPVLAITAYAMRGDRERVMNAGFDGYLSKPINPRDVSNEIERLLQRPEDRPGASPSPRILHSPNLGARS